jgi:hypothetical protein
MKRDLPPRTCSSAVTRVCTPTSPASFSHLKQGHTSTYIDVDYRADNDCGAEPTGELLFRVGEQKPCEIPPRSSSFRGRQAWPMLHKSCNMLQEVSFPAWT